MTTENPKKTLVAIAQTNSLPDEEPIENLLRFSIGPQPQFIMVEPTLLNNGAAKVAMTPYSGRVLNSCPHWPDLL